MTVEAQPARTVAPYGTWPSPIDVELVAAGSGGSSWPRLVHDETWWCASDPEIAGVGLRRCLPGEAAVPVLDPQWSVRNRALGYGGNPYLVRCNGSARELVFTNLADSRVYRADVPALAADSSGATVVPSPLTPVPDDGCAHEYADFIIGPDGTEVWCVREVTRPVGPEGDEPQARTRRDIVAIPLDGSAAQNPAALRVVASGHHFLSGIRLSPDGQRLSWIGWNHPNMPWDSTELVVSDIVDGVCSAATVVLGGPNVSVPQAEWADDDTLYAMADPYGWWNLHRIDLREGSVTCVLPMDRECAGALWRVGATWFAVTEAGIVLRHGVGAAQLVIWNPETGTTTDLAPGWTQFGPDLVSAATAPAIVVTAGAENHGTTVLRVPLPAASAADQAAPILCTPPTRQHLRPWNPDVQRRIAYGPDGREVHYLYYPPSNPDFRGPEGEKPPLLVHVHGGPTSHASGTPDIEFGMFCSRGFAVASVDYGGSTGYGKEYRDRLLRNWGIVDVQDSVTVADDLAVQGLADPDRTAIRGGSAGGWTTLAALAFTDRFCAGAVYYPISDALTWSGNSTHDFESQYLRSLVGELPADLEHYQRVSPLQHADQIGRPLVMLQGADDFICKPDQAQRIVDAVAARGLWHRYLVFEGEGHGFRLRSSVAASLRAEAELYSQVFGIRVDLEHVDLERQHEESPAS